MTPEQLAEKIKIKAYELGFHLCGISGPIEKKYVEFHEWWVQQGFGASMHFLQWQKEKRKDIKNLFPGTKSIIICAVRFPGEKEFNPPQSGEGKLARYSLQGDYHNQILPKLEKLAQYIDLSSGEANASRAYVDTGAISERSLAAQAGLGWIGKNSMLIHPEEGSWFWLGTILTKANIALDQKKISDHCGNCRKCIDACPTQAIFESIRAIDSRKCLAYLNIEHRGAIPESFHKPMGDWLLGCDICQEVCPWNEHSQRKARKEIGAPPLEKLKVDEILSLDQNQFKVQYGKRAISRAKLSGLQRNAIIVKENTKMNQPGKKP
jgi:epoxyqueuosine reductase